MAGKTRFNSLFVPVNLDSALQKLSPKEAKLADRIRWLTHFLIMDCVIGSDSSDGLVGIHSKVLTEALSQNLYKKAIDKAVELKIEVLP